PRGGSRAGGDRPDGMDLCPAVSGVENVRAGHADVLPDRWRCDPGASADAVVVAPGGRCGRLSIPAPRLVGRHDFNDEPAMVPLEVPGQEQVTKRLIESHVHVIVTVGRVAYP